eukprot:6172862-Pleurochrysis_carterae.AAC.2
MHRHLLAVAAKDARPDLDARSDLNASCANRVPQAVSDGVFSAEISKEHPFCPRTTTSFLDVVFACSRASVLDCVYPMKPNYTPLASSCSWRPPTGRCSSSCEGHAYARRDHVIA